MFLVVNFSRRAISEVEVVAHEAVGGDADAGEGLQLSEDGPEDLLFAAIGDKPPVDDARDAVVIGTSFAE